MTEAKGATAEVGREIDIWISAGQAAVKVRRPRDAESAEWILSGVGRGLLAVSNGGVCAL